MTLTPQQLAIIQSTGNIKINAVAGSGKTTTIIEYAKARPTSRILYLAFNKSVKNEAVYKFSNLGVANVRVETAHSLAYSYVVYGRGYKIKKNGYKSHEIAEILELTKKIGRLDAYIVASHVDKYAAYFCNSNKNKVSELNYLDIVSDEKARGYVKFRYKFILEKTREYLALMYKGEIEITHDFYLKQFQLSSPLLPYDYILFDEGQDASPAMLDVFLKQDKAIKVIVGDTHQQIYAWRFAVNSMEKVDFRTFDLSVSFRFNQNLANLAMTYLGWKSYIGNPVSIQITGKGNNQATTSKAVIGRTNQGLLLKAIEYAIESGKVKKIYFEGNINSYTYADEGASLYDILNLYLNKPERIRDKLIRAMKSMAELEEYIDNTGDMQLSMMVHMVKKYGRRMPQILEELKGKHVSDEDKHEAEVIFSTVHRCKGMEYDCVELTPDFIKEEQIQEAERENEEPISPAKLNEEINLLYVAVTRAQNLLYLPDELIPLVTLPTDNIKVLGDEIYRTGNLTPLIPQRQRTIHKKAYEPWTTELDDELTIMYCNGVSVAEMAVHFERTNGAIRSRIKKLELEELYG
ncbi:UvrD-helicase domain-containing protein [Bacteroides sp. 519]|uniref:UvrD-helicase domain-containing protein n=1 Tax=Bacteroides sp. 519 TaxID=2302937 RepID=UPI0013D1D32C|nr:UvrD-helicase domain-containing protein [Bacteroides sp. 519]NDV57848.1 ATP-dependent helicase [Bacteroides sp. 519]